MRIYFSGGSPIPEHTLDGPKVMLSYFVNVKGKNRPDSRLLQVMKLRRKARRKKRD